MTWTRARSAGDGASLRCNRQSQSPDDPPCAAAVARPPLASGARTWAPSRNCHMGRRPSQDEPSPPAQAPHQNLLFRHAFYSGQKKSITGLTTWIGFKSITRKLCPRFKVKRLEEFISLQKRFSSEGDPFTCTLVIPRRYVGGCCGSVGGFGDWFILGLSYSSGVFGSVSLWFVGALEVHRNMGCIISSDAIDDGGILELPLLSGEVYVFVPGFREPTQNDLTELLKGSVSAPLATKLQSLRSQVIAASLGTTVPGMKIRQSKLSLDGDLDLEKALKDYLPVLLGLVTGGEKFSSAIEYPWTNAEDERKETSLASGYYELLSVLHLLGMLALQEANLCLTPRPPANAYTPKASEGMCFGLHPVVTFGRYISASLSWYKLSDENKRNAIQILLKAASYFECAVNAVLPNTPDEIKAKLPVDLTEAMLRSLEQQALGQVVELQLGFAIDNVKASLAVKRRLACEQVEVWEQAIEKLVSVPLAAALRDKHFLFVKWKLAEAKAAAYYFHGLILDEGYEANTHAQSLSCLKAAHAHLKESQKARTEFGNTEPLTKVTALWGPVKYLAERIPRDTMSRGSIFRDNYSKEKFPATTPKLPEFPIALEADLYRLPAVDPAWKKERGFEARPSLTPDVPSFLVKRNQSPTRTPFSDLRRAEVLAPTLILSDVTVEAR